MRRTRWAGCTRATISRAGACTSKRPVTTRYRGIDVYKLDTWVQGPVMLQALNLLEPLDVKGMGYNSRAISAHAVSGDEPRFRRSRLLLRRSVLPAEGADRRAAVQGLRTCTPRVR